MVLILLCTFKSNNLVNSTRNNIEDRLSDYFQTIKLWLEEDYFSNIIIVENSGYEFKKFNNLINDFKTSKLIEFIQFDGNNFDTNLGKGYGVYELIKQVVNKSEIYKRNKKFTFVAGRYYIRNYKKILKNSQYDIISDFQKSLTYAFNPIFFCTSSFIEEYLLKELVKSNDLSGIHFEHCLAKAVHRALADGLTWDLPCEVPIVNGISGTTNMPYYKNFPHRFLITMYSRIKYFIFKFAR